MATEAWTDNLGSSLSSETTLRMSSILRYTQFRFDNPFWSLSCERHAVFMFLQNSTIINHHQSHSFHDKVNITFTSFYLTMAEITPKRKSNHDDLPPKLVSNTHSNLIHELLLLAQISGTPIATFRICRERRRTGYVESHPPLTAIPNAFFFRRRTTKLDRTTIRNHRTMLSTAWLKHLPKSYARLDP